MTPVCDSDNLSEPVEGVYVNEYLISSNECAVANEYSIKATGIL